MYTNYSNYEIGFDISSSRTRNFLFKRFEKGERIIWNPYDEQLCIFSHDLLLEEIDDLTTYYGNSYYYLLLEDSEVVKCIMFNHLTRMFDFNFHLYALFTNQNSLDAKIILNIIYSLLIQDPDKDNHPQIIGDYLLTYEFFEYERTYIPWEVIKDITSFPVEKYH